MRQSRRDEYNTSNSTTTALATTTVHTRHKQNNHQHHHVLCDWCSSHHMATCINYHTINAIIRLPLIQCWLLFFISPPPQFAPPPRHWVFQYPNQCIERVPTYYFYLPCFLPNYVLSTTHFFVLSYNSVGPKSKYENRSNNLDTSFAPEGNGR
jgi:hypothetical protein